MSQRTPHHSYAARTPLDDATPPRVLLLTLSKLEADYVDEMRRRGGFTTDADVMRCGLWHLAHHLDLIVAPPVFAIGDSANEP